MMNMSYRDGFTLIELMIVVAIIACLSILSVPSLLKVLAKAKRTEAYLYLRAIAQAEKIYYAEHGRYTTILNGPNGLGWKPEGSYNYTYGFTGTQEGVGHFIGKLGTPALSLSGAQISDNRFTIAAAGNIYGETPDILTIDEQGVITLISDALQK